MWTRSFFFNDTATTEIYTLSLHDALPISEAAGWVALDRSVYGMPLLVSAGGGGDVGHNAGAHQDRKSTRLNSSHSQISYAVFCLKKKTKHNQHRPLRSLYSQRFIRLAYDS